MFNLDTDDAVVAWKEVYKVVVHQDLKDIMFHKQWLSWRMGPDPIASGSPP